MGSDDSIKDPENSGAVSDVPQSNFDVYIGTDNGLVRIPEQKLHL